MVKTLKVKDPINVYECNFGQISNDSAACGWCGSCKTCRGTDLYIKQKKNLGEIIDVYCVAKNKKKLAALDFSTYGKNKLRKRNKALINKVIKYCNSKNVKALHNKKTGGMYVKTIFFTQKNYKNALKLMEILWNLDLPINPIDHSIAIGLLLGYKRKNIIAFVEKNYKIKLDPKNHHKWKIVFKIIQDGINKMNVSLEDLNKHSKVVLLDPIPTI